MACNFMAQTRLDREVYLFPDRFAVAGLSHRTGQRRQTHQLRGFFSGRSLKETKGAKQYGQGALHPLHRRALVLVSWRLYLLLVIYLA